MRIWRRGGKGERKGDKEKRGENVGVMVIGRREKRKGD